MSDKSAQDARTVPVKFDPDEIPEEAWCYIIGVKPGLTVTGPGGAPLGPEDNETGPRPILDSEGEQVGLIPAGLAHWSGSREIAEEFIADHPSGDCLEVVRVLILDCKEKTND